MSERPPDVEISAAVRAEELRFECKPEVRVFAHSDTPASAAIEAERENLPEELEAGTTYRDLAVRWRAWARLDDLEFED